jgi:hypothetical protein
MSVSIGEDVDGVIVGSKVSLAKICTFLFVFPEEEEDDDVSYP